MALPKPSAALLKTCRKYKLRTPMHKVFCDLILAGWEKEDAYAFSGLWNNTYSTIMNIQEMNRLMQENNISEYINDKAKEAENKKKKAQKEEALSKAIDAAQISEQDMANALSKETQLRELLIAKNSYTVGSKEWLDVKKMIADLTKIKNEDMQDEEDVVHFYVPIQCHNCSLYMKTKGNK